MAVTILPKFDTGQLHVSGDIQANLLIPAKPPEPFWDGGTLCYPYYISLSDGTLIKALYDSDPSFDVIVEGAGVVIVDEAGASLSVAWDVEWINLSIQQHGCAVAQKSPRNLPLFHPELGQMSVIA